MLLYNLINSEYAAIIMSSKITGILCPMTVTTVANRLTTVRTTPPPPSPHTKAKQTMGLRRWTNNTKTMDNETLTMPTAIYHCQSLLSDYTMEKTDLVTSSFVP